MKPHLRLIRVKERPLGPLTRAEKLAKAIGWLRSRNRYILDQGAKQPGWGIPGSVKKQCLQFSLNCGQWRHG